jgi:hypothetical protein
MNLIKRTINFSAVLIFGNVLLSVFFSCSGTKVLSDSIPTKISIEQEYLSKYASDQNDKFEYPDTNNAIKILASDANYFSRNYQNNINYKKFWFFKSTIDFVGVFKEPSKDGLYMVINDYRRDGFYMVVNDNPEKNKNIIALIPVKNGKIDGKRYLFDTETRVNKILEYDKGTLLKITTFNHLGETYSKEFFNEKGIDSTVFFGKKLYERRNFSMDDYSINFKQKCGYTTLAYEPLKEEEEDLDTYNHFRIIEERSDFYEWNNYSRQDVFYGDAKILRFNGKEFRFNKYGDKSNFGFIESDTNCSEDWKELNTIDSTYYFDLDPYHYCSSSSYLNAYKTIKQMKNLITLSVYSYPSIYWKENELIEEEYSNNSDYYDSIEYVTGIHRYKPYSISLLPDLKPMPYLENIEIYSNQNKLLKKKIYSINSLKTLSLSSQKLDEVIKGIQKCQNIETLTISGQVDDFNKLILECSKLPKLKILYIKIFDGKSIPTNLYLLKNLEVFSLIIHGKIDWRNQETPVNFKLDSSHIKNFKNLNYFVSNLFTPELKTYLNKNMPKCFISEPGDGCLAKGTKVSLVNNKDLPIEQLKIGDSLLAYNEITKLIDTTVVTNTFAHLTHFNNCLSIELEINGKVQTIQTTDNHPFFCKEKGWVKAGELTGDFHLLIHDTNSTKGTFIKIKSITKLIEGLPEVYNIETSIHNYFANGILVHNK